MKKQILLCLVALLFGITAVKLSGQDKSASIQNQFVGAWRLVSLESPGADGRMHRSDSTGLLVFTGDGHMSVQVMERNPRPQTAPGPEQYSQGGYEASFGTYQVNQNAHTLDFHVEGALVRTLIGKNLPRSYAFSGKQLIIQSTRADEHWKVIWEHD